LAGRIDWEYLICTSKRREEIRSKRNTFNDKGSIHKNIFNTMPPDCKPVHKQLLEYKPQGRREPRRPLSIRKDNFNSNRHFIAAVSAAEVADNY
jgi:hypothetical protein